MNVVLARHSDELPIDKVRLLTPPTPGQRWVITILVLFLLFFPKGGIKLGGVPITWGYLALMAVSLYLPIAFLKQLRWKIRRERLLLALALVPFQAVVWLSFLLNGVTGIGFSMSLVVSFFFIPLVFLLVIGPVLDGMEPSYLYRWIRRGVLFVATYGIFLFVYRLLVGEFVEIPLLTVNAGDLGELDGKYIDRGGIFKLISTYNNGNIYGVSILMLLPLYAFLERSRWRVGVVKLSLLLTLSRTVWAGLLFFEIIQRIYVRRVSARAIAVLFASLTLVVAGVFGALHLMGVDPSVFLLDRSLGGRVNQLEALRDATVLPRVSFEHILEMVYLSILSNFGLIGLASYLLAMTMPVWLHAYGVTPFSRSEYKRSLAAGLCIYLFVSLSDGALLFIPVAAFYWFLVTLIISPSAVEGGSSVGDESRAEPAVREVPAWGRSGVLGALR